MEKVYHPFDDVSVILLVSGFDHPFGDLSLILLVLGCLSLIILLIIGLCDFVLILLTERPLNS